MRIKTPISRSERLMSGGVVILASRFHSGFFAQFGELVK